MIIAEIFYIPAVYMKPCISALASVVIRIRLGHVSSGGASREITCWHQVSESSAWCQQVISRLAPPDSRCFPLIRAPESRKAEQCLVWLSQCPVTCLAPSHYLKQWRFMDNSATDTNFYCIFVIWCCSLFNTCVPVYIMHSSNTSNLVYFPFPGFAPLKKYANYWSRHGRNKYEPKS